MYYTLLNLADHMNLAELAQLRLARARKKSRDLEEEGGGFAEVVWALAFFSRPKPNY